VAPSPPASGQPAPLPTPTAVESNSAAGEDESAPPHRRRDSFLKIGPYAGYFQPSDSLLKKIYGDGDVIYGARLGFRIWRSLTVWLQAAQYQVTGQTTFTEDRSTLTIQPISLLARFSLPFRGIRPYVGAGMVYTSFREESSIGTVKGNGQSWIAEGGLEFVASRRFTLDLGVTYNQVKVSPTGFSINLGGLAGGLALYLTF
jgi:opacity protein-like surface antigen